MKLISRFQSQGKRWFKFLYFTLMPICIFTHPSSTVIAEEYEETNCTIFPSVPSQIAATRLYNINLMHNVLKKDEYDGYDIIMISSTTIEEAKYQQQLFEKAFAGTSKKDGSQPIILSVVDTNQRGQLIGAVHTWHQAEEMLREKYPKSLKGYRDLIDYIRKNRLKVAAFHNGGKGERCSPLTQSSGNSRGSQKLVGSIKNAQDEEFELEVLLGVVLQCSSFATTNHGTHIDTFWTSQIAFGSNPHDQLTRSNFGLDKFLVGFDKEQLIPQNIADFGTAALTSTGRMVTFYGNKRFAIRKMSEYVVDLEKIERELLDKGERVAYDFGSFSTSLDMWQLLVDYWQKKDVFQPISLKDANPKRDIDPHFIQPFIRLLYGMNDLADRKMIDEQLPSPVSLATQMALNDAREKFEIIVKENFPQAYFYIWEDIHNEPDVKKKAEGVTCLNEVIEFYLLYRENDVFADLHKIFGFIDLGDDTQWFRYRRPIDIMNEKFEMLTDLIGNKIEVQLNGSIQECEAQESLIQRCCEARLMRGIKEHEIAKFTVEGKAVTMTIEEMKVGKIIDNVYVKNSIIQNCDLTKGSYIINSVVNHVTGKVIAEHSYLESSTAPCIRATASVVHEVIDLKHVKADREVVSDVYKSKLSPSYHGRMRAPIGYDPKGMPIFRIVRKNENGIPICTQEIDETIRYFVERIPYDLREAKEYSDETARTEDGRFTFEEIRGIEPLRAADMLFRAFLNEIAKKAIGLKRSK